MLEGSMSFERLACKVQIQTSGQLRLVDTPDKGRCLEAAEALRAGCRIQDRPVVRHGSDHGKHLLRATALGTDVTTTEASGSLNSNGGDGGPPPTVSSGDLLAGLDFLASLVYALSQRSLYDAEGGGSNSATATEAIDINDDIDILWGLYSFPDEEAEERVPMVRKWHGRWRQELSRNVPVELVEAAWRHVVPNWRQLLAAPLQAAWLSIGVKDGCTLQPSLEHELVCGLWLLMALCEHSCDPNCALSHDGTDLWFHALRPIAAGEALTTSYLDIEGLCLPVRLRRKRLQERWNFECSCRRCLAEIGGTAPKDGGDRNTDMNVSGGYASASSEREATLGSLASPIARQVPRWGHVHALQERLRTPPGEDDSERTAYCDALRQLMSAVKSLVGSVDPTFQALLLRTAIFVPDGDAATVACGEYLDVCVNLFGADSAITAGARLLLEAPERYHAEAHAGSRVFCMSSFTGAKPTALESGNMASEEIARAALPTSNIARASLRAMYRQHLQARNGPRYHEAKSCAAYIACVGFGDETEKRDQMG